MDNYYIKIDPIPREIVYLQGTGCQWGACESCEYKDLTNQNPYEYNLPIIEQVTGVYSRLDVITTGSFCELDPLTLQKLKETIIDKKIQTLAVDLHYMYHLAIPRLKCEFPCNLIFYCLLGGIERKKQLMLSKGIPKNVSIYDIAKHFKGVNIVCCIHGETRESILEEIINGLQTFEYLHLQLSHEKMGPVQRNEELVQWFIETLYPTMKKNPRVTIEM